MRECDTTRPPCFSAGGWSPSAGRAFLQFRRDRDWYEYPCTHLEWRALRYGSQPWGCRFNLRALRPLWAEGIGIAAPPDDLLDRL